MMAAKREPIIQNGSLKENNLLHRIWHLPVVSSAFSGLQKMYSTAKDAHPLVTSICSVYEQGLRSASSLAAWSMKPVVQKLKPQLAAVNALACRGLDHLEQKIPALNQPVEKPVENGTFVQNLQAASLAIVLSVRKAPFIIWNLLGQILQVSPCTTGSEAGAEGDTLKGTLHHLTRSLLRTLAFCIPFLKVPEQETEPTSDTHSESGQEEDDIEPEEKGIPYYLFGSRRSSRGHHPLFFLNLDDPLPSEQPPYRRRSKAFEAEYTIGQRSAFSPYKEANSKRRMSEGMCRPSTEVLCTRAHYKGLISATFKKD